MKCREPRNLRKIHLVKDFFAVPFALKLIIIFLFSLESKPIRGQSIPQGIAYQAVARSFSGQVISGVTIKVRFTIRDSIPVGRIIFRETHSPSTSQLGLFSLTIGFGNVIQGNFSFINWGRNPKFLQVEIDPAGGNAFIDLGTTQMMAVPYAFSAGTCATANSALNWTPPESGYGEVKLYNCDGLFQHTPCLPKISTQPVTVVSASIAQTGGLNLLSGGAEILVKGVCWSSNPNPTVSLPTKTSNGFGAGNFLSTITGLVPNTTYYSRAYATSNIGTSYGNQVVFSTTGTLNPTDVDGNSYQMVAVGNQIWMKENLRVTRFRNGDQIATNLSDSQWAGFSTGAYAVFGNNAANNNTYGKLYNWYAVADPRGLCPNGWHVPTDHDWNTLTIHINSIADTSCIGCLNSAGGPLKSTGTLEAGTGLWNIPNSEATNSTGFSGLPGGLRVGGTTGFGDLGKYGFWWSVSESPLDNTGLTRRLGFGDGSLARGVAGKSVGLSVRCLRD